MSKLVTTSRPGVLAVYSPALLHPSYFPLLHSAAQFRQSLLFSSIPVSRCIINSIRIWCIGSHLLSSFWDTFLTTFSVQVRCQAQGTSAGAVWGRMYAQGLSMRTLSSLFAGCLPSAGDLFTSKCSSETVSGHFVTMCHLTRQERTCTALLLRVSILCLRSLASQH